MKGWRFTVLETLVAVSAGIALMAVYTAFGKDWAALATGIVVFGFSAAGLLATDAFISGHPMYILGLESEKLLRVEFRVGGILLTIGALAWIVYCARGLMAGGIVLPSL